MGTLLGHCWVWRAAVKIPISFKKGEQVQDYSDKVECHRLPWAGQKGWSDSWHIENWPWEWSHLHVNFVALKCHLGASVTQNWSPGKPSRRPAFEGVLEAGRDFLWRKHFLGELVPCEVGCPEGASFVSQEVDKHLAGYRQGVQVLFWKLNQRDVKLLPQHRGP